MTEQTSTIPSHGKVLWHFTMSLDGFIAGPNHSMDWLSGLPSRPGLVEELAATVGAILAGRRGYDAGAAVAPGNAASLPYGGAFHGPIFVLTHHPQDAVPDPDVTFLDCGVDQAVATGLAAAGGKNLEIFSADVGRQCVMRGLIDEFHVHLAPVMLGDGVRLFACPGIEPVRWERIHDGDPAQAGGVVDLRYRPARWPLEGRWPVTTSSVLLPSQPETRLVRVPTAPFPAHTPNPALQPPRITRNAGGGGDVKTSWLSTTAELVLAQIGRRRRQRSRWRGRPGRGWAGWPRGR
jgi:dihydrofolate reductase